MLEQNLGARPAYPVQPFKDKAFALEFLALMIRARVLEERLIKMSRSGDGFFWIGGPGEEAFNIALGLQVQKGLGPEHDFLHLHYRNNGVVLAMGEPMVSFVRQMRSVSTDPFSGGRNFVSHIAKKEWNVMPVTSTIETQFSVAPGSARVQMKLRRANKPAGITVVVGGDAGTAEGDFATALVWASRPNDELPLLMIVTNNQFGISTPANSQHGEKSIADRAKAFRIATNVVDGNSPERIWNAVRDAMDHVRTSGKPFLLEVQVSRLNGHSSSSGAARITSELCPVTEFQKKLVKLGWLTEEKIKALWDAAVLEGTQALETARAEFAPLAETVQDHTFADGVRGGLPGKDF